MFCHRLVVLAFLAASLSTIYGKAPHIIFMVADDLGWNDIGFNNPDIISPNVNKLAETGVILNHSYVQPLCSPSRSSFMTGYYPFRMGLQHMVIGDSQKVCAPLNKTFLPQVLKENGYATHMTGKWHLGFCKLECTPNYRGFDSYFGYYTSEEQYYTKMHGNGVDFHNNTVVYRNASGNYSSYQYGSAVENIIHQHNPEQPLFLYFPIQSVHEPLQAPEYYYNLYPNITNKNRRTFSGMVTALDDAVGKMVDALKEKDMYNDTIIFFTADNGGWIPYSGNNYPLRGGKMTVWEGGTRVPAFVHSQLLSKTGVRYDGMMHAVDWFPTIVEAAGAVHVDPDRDGVSQWKNILSLGPSQRTEFVYNFDNSTQPTQGKAAIRVGDYKLIEGYPGQWNSWYKPATVWSGPLPRSDYSDSHRHFESPENINWKNFTGLFNLRDDPFEHDNLYDKLPEVVKKLQARMSYYYTKMIPANYPAGDPKANPKYWDGAWQPGWC